DRVLDTLRFDVVADDVRLLADAAARAGVTHLYYYATPRIFARRREPFDDELFARFAEVYVAAFARICAAVRGAVPSLDVFYPSSTAVEEPVAELTEYAAAKAAGESLCRPLDRPADGLRIVARRLPRVATDQTASIIEARALD